MPVLFRPKETFQRNTAEREAWQKLANDPLLHKAMTYAMADMDMAGFTPEQMVGARTFALALLNLSESVEAQKPLPTKALTSYDNPPPTITK